MDWNNLEEVKQYHRAYYLANDHANAGRSERLYAARLTSPWKDMIHAARGRAKAKGVPFDLNDEWGAEHWTGECELTGITFWLGQRSSGPKFFSPSIDRVEPKIGYLKFNCRFVLWCVNAFKSEGTDADMVFVAKALIRQMNA